MRRHVTRYIEHVKSRPEEERVQHALVWASIFTGLIFVIWLFFFFARLAQPTIVVIPPEAPATTQDTVDRILDEAQYGGLYDSATPEASTGTESAAEQTGLPR